MEQSAPPKPVEEEAAPAIEYTESVLAQRLVAGVIDFGVAGSLSWIANLVLPDFLGSTATGLAIAYLLLKDSLPFLDGQSIGKKVMKLRAVTADGNSLSGNFAKSALRNIFFAVPILALVEIFILHNREKEANAGLRLGDDFAKTKVIAESSQNAADATGDESTEA
ncbi:RDD family protein [Roseibacillus ishigakijimensis]|uniref:RDD family protein n=1 Tax=Roseibacillus ishigakijimensis TaxID=454146 RepID=A0A934RQM5_9BACT|nr:RDD family protein [Roseibacillus ishigakijimensis]MBK1834087.1 RDD family protein [Roseibacillus ishigakijimensis]